MSTFKSVAVQWEGFGRPIYYKKIKKIVMEEVL